MTAAAPEQARTETARDGAAPQATASVRWRLALKVALSALILGLLLHTMDLGRLSVLLAGVDPWLACLAIVVLMTVPAISIPRWRAILSSLGEELPTPTVARALYVGAFFNQVLPSSVGGDAWRIWFCTRAGVPLGVAANSVLIERLVGLVAVVLCFCLTIPVLLGRVGDHPARWLLWLMLAGCVGVLLGLAVLAAIAGRLDRSPLLRPLASLGRALSTVARSSHVGLLLWTGLLGQAAAILAFYLVSRGAGAPLTLVDCAVTLAPGLLIALVPVSLGGWGVREGAFVLLLGFYGMRPEQSLVVSVLFGLALLAASMPGLVLWLRLPAAASRRTDPSPDRR
ncbi:lysylphosphatidylglycerol synthase transmembrane domain-containing protein [Reyranella sp.]|uniref:lysylphosphatidylglycerol synthase transmembrane domain-containing protein n=1 Tax=Reyranella sp. TaxID=1929291 RepID=UPI003BA8CC64